MRWLKKGAVVWSPQILETYFRADPKKNPIVVALYVGRGFGVWRDKGGSQIMRLELR